MVQLLLFEKIKLSFCSDGPKYTVLNKSDSGGNFEEMWKKLQDSGKKDDFGPQEPKKDIQHGNLWYLHCLKRLIPLFSWSLK